MIRKKTLIAGFFAATAGLYALAAPTSSGQSRGTPGNADAAHPAVIELYQSQGCSSCPPALAVLDRVADRPDVLALNFAVTYWDRLGWKDIYAQPAFTARQWDYSRAQGRSNVQTPQLIVNGRIAVLGSNQSEVEQTIARSPRLGGPVISASAGRVTIGTGTAALPATVWYVAYDPRTVQVPIRAGENGGRTLPHRNIVHELRPIGTWTGKSLSLAVPTAASGLAQATFVQAGKGGPIVAAARL